MCYLLDDVKKDLIFAVLNARWTPGDARGDTLGHVNLCLVQLVALCNKMNKI